MKIALYAWFDLTLYSDPFSPEAIKYAKDKMQNFDVFSPEHTQPFLQEGIHILELHVFVILYVKLWFSFILTQI